MKKETPVLLPPYKENYELNESQQNILHRIVEELESRLQSTITIEVYKLNQIIYPKTFVDSIHVELRTGNWKRIGIISSTELDMDYGQAFYYFMRRMADESMSELLIRGARTF